MRHAVVFTLAVVMLGIGGRALAQGRETGDESTDRAKAAELRQLGGVASLLPPQCAASGSGESYLLVCITEHGNVSRFESPQNVVHITGREGYVLTSSNGNFDFPVDIEHGFDAGTAEAGWGQPSVSQPKGPGTLPMTVTRTSLDGRVQFSQTFTLNAAERGLDIRMDVRNVGSTPLIFTRLGRYFDGDMNGTAAGDIYDLSKAAVWAHQKAFVAGPGGSFETLALSGAPSPYSFWPEVETYDDWNPTGAKGRYARTNVTPPTEPAPTVQGDFVGRLLIFFDEIAVGQMKSVTVRYRRF